MKNFDESNYLDNSVNNNISKAKVAKELFDFSELAIFLRLGFMPPPYTGLVNSTRQCLIQSNDNFNLEDLKENFLYFQKENSTPKKYSFNEFNEQFLKMVERNISKDKKYLLMLSGGKDSSSLLLALHDLGMVDNIVCATYVSGIKEDESSDALSLCEKLGYKHLTVKSNIQDEFLIYKKCVSSSPSLCADFALPAYLYTIEKAKATFDFDIVIDGMGNDIYMGHIPPKVETRLQTYSLTNFTKKLWGRHNFITGNKELSYLLQSLEMLPVERSFSGSRLSFKNITKAGFDTELVKGYIENLQSLVDGENIYNARAFARGAFYDDLCCCEKARVATSFNDIEVVFPFIDSEFSDYYMSLDLDERFDFSIRKNKVSLRKYLSDKFDSINLAENQYVSQKGSFRFDFENFIRSNISSIAEDIDTFDSQQSSINLSSVFNELKKSLNDYTACSQIFLIYSVAVWVNGKRN